LQLSLRPIAPPAWSGPVLVHRLLDEAEEDEDQAAAVAIASGRICTHCGGAFPPTGEFFYRSKGARDGLRPECKKCTAEFPTYAKRRTQPRRTKQPEDWSALAELQRRAAKAVLLACPAWTLISPGSPREALVRQVPAALWWPYPKETACQSTTRR
jgi:hypothetical protein